MIQCSLQTPPDLKAFEQDRIKNVKRQATELRKKIKSRKRGLTKLKKFAKSFKRRNILKRFGKALSKAKIKEKNIKRRKLKLKIEKARFFDKAVFEQSFFKK